MWVLGAGLWMLGLGACAPQHFETLSENLPAGLKTHPCVVGAAAGFWKNIYQADDGRVLLLSKSGEHLRYLVDHLRAEQTAKTWYMDLFQKMADEAVKSGISGFQLRVPVGSPLHLAQEGSTYYVKDKVLETSGTSVTLASLLCAITDDEAMLVFAGSSHLVPKSELIAKRTLYRKAFGGEEKDDLEARILEAAEKKLAAQDRKGAKLIREPASIKLDRE
jgi:hypothetical protein